MGWGVPVRVKTEEIKRWNSERLQVIREEVRKDSEHVVLDFEEEVLPKKVTLGFLSWPIA